MSLKAKDIRDKLRGKVETDLLHTLEALAEIQHQQGKQIVECASLCAIMVNQLEAFNMIAEGMKRKLVSLERNMTDSDPEQGARTQ